MFSFDEKRYTSACIEPPVPKLFFAQLDALNDCLVIENLEKVAAERKLSNVVFKNATFQCRLSFIFRTGSESLAPNFRVNECCQISTIAALFSGQPLF
jgi:hypothetical protein